jgi:hypothetical protein
VLDELRRFADVERQPEHRDPDGDDLATVAAGDQDAGGVVPWLDGADRQVAAQ